jgi:hypothetical protein
MLEATLLFGGMGLHDQHSDLRLDVDNMSYEELLALEERIGQHKSDCRGGSPKAEKKSIFLPGCNGCSFLRGMRY